MAKKCEVYKIMIASPSDVEEEWIAIQDSISRWNIDNSDKISVVLIPVRWSSHAVPELGAPPQRILNKQLLDNSDILIGIFWSRIGTQTVDSESGTVDEIEYFRKKNGPVMLYFSSKEIDPYIIDEKQFNSVKKLKERFKQDGIVWEFSNISDLKNEVYRHINSAIHKIRSTKSENEESIKESIKNFDPEDNNKPLIENLNSPKGILYRVFERIETFGQGEQKELKTGVIELDSFLSFIDPGRILLISGEDVYDIKKLYCKLISNITIDSGKLSAIFCLNENDINFITRLLCFGAGIELNRVLNGTLSPNDVNKLGVFAGPTHDSQMFIIKEWSLSISKLEMFIDEIEKKEDKNIEAIFIDGIFEFIMRNSEQQSKNYTSVLDDLKKVSYKKGAPIIATCEIEYDNLDKQQLNKKPTLNLLPRYGNISQLTDFVLFIMKSFKPEFGSDEYGYELSIAKNHYGPIGTLLFDKELKFHI